MPTDWSQLTVPSTLNGDGGHETWFVPAVNSPAMQHLDCVIANLAASDVPLLLVGEAGTGKQSLALHIHRCSNRADQPFLVIDGRKLRAPGAEAGKAQDGASEGFEVFLTRATIYLKNVGELDAESQQYLLRLLSSPQEPVRARIIASTREPLEPRLAAGRFAEELHYRINSICLQVPPLRHRRDDIPILADFFAAKYSALFGRITLMLNPAVLELLCEHSWPGNVRELESILKAAAAVGDASVVLKALRPAAHPAADAEWSPKSLKQAARAASLIAEKALMLQVLERTAWNRKRAAEELQISYKALLYKLKQTGITRPERPKAMGGAK